MIGQKSKSQTSKMVKEVRQRLYVIAGDGMIVDNGISALFGGGGGIQIFTDEAKAISRANALTKMHKRQFMPLWLYVGIVTTPGIDILPTIL